MCCSLSVLQPGKCISIGQMMYKARILMYKARMLIYKAHLLIYKARILMYKARMLMYKARMLMCLGSALRILMCCPACHAARGQAA